MILWVHYFLALFIQVFKGAATWAGLTLNDGKCEIIGLSEVVRQHWLNYGLNLIEPQLINSEN